MSEYKINQLVLSFPHGANAYQCSLIAQKAEKIIMAGVSEGGMLLEKGSFYKDEPMEFSEDTMHFVFGYNKKEVQGE